VGVKQGPSALKIAKLIPSSGSSVDVMAVRFLPKMYMRDRLNTLNLLKTQRDANDRQRIGLHLLARFPWISDGAFNASFNSTIGIKIDNEFMPGKADLTLSD
jgi:hypothetical protein